MNSSVPGEHGDAMGREVVWQGQQSNSHTIHGVLVPTLLPTCASCPASMVLACMASACRPVSASRGVALGQSDTTRLTRLGGSTCRCVCVGGGGGVGRGGGTHTRVGRTACLRKHPALPLGCALGCSQGQPQLMTENLMLPAEGCVREGRELCVYGEKRQRAGCVQSPVLPSAGVHGCLLCLQMCPKGLPAPQAVLLLLLVAARLITSSACTANSPSPVQLREVRAVRCARPGCRCLRCQEVKSGSTDTWSSCRKHPQHSTA